MIIELNDACRNEKALVGNKAWNLSFLASQGYQIESGFCITSSFFSDFLKMNEIEINEESADRIMSGQFSDVQIDLIKSYFAQLGDDKLVIVRSSGVNEDDESGSMAGAYKSISNITKYIDLFNAIKMCWASFIIANNNLPFLRDNVCVLVQKQLLPDWSGVLFTQNPIMKNNNMYIELVQGGCDLLVSGIAQGTKIEYNTDKRLFVDLPIEIASIKPMLTKLATQAEHIKVIMNAEQDIEWAIKGDVVHILQSRPIAKRNRKTLNSIEIINNYDANRVLNIDPHNLQEYYSNYVKKHLWIHNFANKNGIKIPNGFFIIYNEELIAQTKSETLSNLFEIQSVDIRYKGMKGKMASSADALKDDMLRIIRDMKASGEITIHAKEYIPNQISGYSTQLQDTVIIEYSIGGLMGLCSGLVEPSVCVIDERALIVSHEFKKNDSYYVYDDRHKEFRYMQYTEIQEPLSDEMLQEIYNMTKALCSRFPDARVEWYVYNGILYLSDLSLEESFTQLNANIGHILSSGNIEGQVVKIDDLGMFHEFWDKYDISVNISPDRIIAEKDEKLFGIIERLKRFKSPIILAEYPIPTLSVLVNYAQGFVFEKGSVLSHLGIILRENGIPGYFIPGAMSKYSEGECIKINSDLGGV